jgi:hypothetical protein
VLKARVRVGVRVACSGGAEGGWPGGGMKSGEARQAGGQRACCSSAQQGVRSTHKSNRVNPQTLLPGWVSLQPSHPAPPATLLLNCC